MTLWTGDVKLNENSGWSTNTAFLADKGHFLLCIPSLWLDFSEDYKHIILHVKLLLLLWASAYKNVII